MKLRHLEAFREILTTGSVSEAAKHLEVSQPAVSRMLAQLEEDFGFDLFFRDRGRLIATREAEALRTEVDQALDGLGKLSEIAANLRIGRTGALNFGCSQSLAFHFVPDIIREFATAWSGVRVTAEPRPNHVIIELIANRSLDLAVLTLPVEHPGVEIEPIRRFESVCVVPSRHRLAKHETLAPPDLAEEALILLSKSDPARFPIDAAFRDERVAPRVAFETPSVALATQLAARGCGIAIVNELMARDTSPKGVRLTPFRPVVLHKIALIRPADVPASAECKAFAEIVRANLQGLDFPGQADPPPPGTAL